MSEKPDYNSRDLRLHRKYILVICFVLIFLKYGGVSLEQVSFLGAVFQIDNPQAIYLGLYIILAYSAIRYYQYFRSQSYGHFKNEFLQLMYILYNPLFFKLVERRIAPDRISKIDSRGNTASIPQTHSGMRIGWMRRKVKTRVSIEGRDKNVSEHDVEFECHLIWDFKLPYLKTILHFTFLGPVFFEYIVPFFILIGTIIYCSTGDWSGNLVR